jgi:hypothetical protein
MKDKEKQIEEMAKDFKCCYSCEMFNGYEANGELHNCNCEAYNKPENCAIARTVAKCLIADGYRKIDKDSVVLSREELEKIKTNNFSYGVEKGYKSGLLKASKETAEKFMVLRGYITKQFHKYHEARDKAESEYKKCKEEMGKAVLNNDWHRCDSIMFILEDIATQFDELAKQFGVEIKE